METIIREFVPNKFSDVRGGHSILETVRLGDFIECGVDGRFFQRADGNNERYAGYVTVIKQEEIELSPTHPSNRCHGYSDKGTNDRPQVTVPILVHLIRNYWIAP